MPYLTLRFEVGEEVIIKLRGRIIGRGNITRVSPFGGLYRATLNEPNDNGLINIYTLDNKNCGNHCKYGHGVDSYQIYKLEEVNA